MSSSNARVTRSFTRAQAANSAPPSEQVQEPIISLNKRRVVRTSVKAKIGQAIVKTERPVTENASSGPSGVETLAEEIAPALPQATLGNPEAIELIEPARNSQDNVEPPVDGNNSGEGSPVPSVKAPTPINPEDKKPGIVRVRLLVGEKDKEDAVQSESLSSTNPKDPDIEKIGTENSETLNTTQISAPLPGDYSKTKQSTSAGQGQRNSKSAAGKATAKKQGPRKTNSQPGRGRKRQSANIRNKIHPPQSVNEVEDESASDKPRPMVLRCALSIKSGFCGQCLKTQLRGWQEKKNQKGKKKTGAGHIVPQSIYYKSPSLICAKRFDTFERVIHKRHETLKNNVLYLENNGDWKRIKVNGARLSRADTTQVLQFIDVKYHEQLMEMYRLELRLHKDAKIAHAAGDYNKFRVINDSIQKIRELYHSAIVETDEFLSKSSILPPDSFDIHPHATRISCPEYLASMCTECTEGARIQPEVMTYAKPT